MNPPIFDSALIPAVKIFFGAKQFAFRQNESIMGCST